MQGLVDVDAWRQILVTSLTGLGQQVAGFLPNLLGALLILGVGWGLARLLRKISTRALNRFGFDRACEHLRVASALRHAGVTQAPSALLGFLLFWIVMLGFLLAAAEAMGLSAVASTISRLVAFLPNVLAAALILIAGALFGRFLRNLVLSAARLGRYPQAPQLASAVNGIVILVVLVLALDQLGIETRILVTVITALVIAVSLTSGLALALGARALVGHILAGHFLRQSLPMEGTVAVKGRRGVVERVGPVDTILRDDESSWSIPNSILLEEIVER